MNTVHVRKLPDGWQSYINSNGRIIVLDTYFEHEEDTGAN